MGSPTTIRVSHPSRGKDSPRISWLRSLSPLRATVGDVIWHDGGEATSLVATTSRGMATPVFHYQFVRSSTFTRFNRAAVWRLGD
jgi:hypothetical protein